MDRLKLADGRGGRGEEVAGITVQSSGGIPALWPAVLDMVQPGQRLLDYGSWQGIAALCHIVKGGRATFASRFASELRQVEKNATANGIELPVEPMFPPEGNWDTIVLPLLPAGLEFMVGHAAASLAPDGKLLVPGEDAPALSAEARLRVYFGNVAREKAVWVCTDPRAKTAELPWQKAVVQVRQKTVELETLPLLFSPAGLDQGSRLMLEEAEIPAGARVLDLGCGWGVVGIMASLLGGGETVYVDDDLAAVEATRHNLERTGLTGSVIHTHDPHGLPGSFDVMLTNPPYHTDFATAKTFLEFARRRLRPGGWAYVVVKRRDWYENKLKALFGGCRVVFRDGYWLLAARQTGAPKARVAAKTTRKHRKRMEGRRQR